MVVVNVKLVNFLGVIFYFDAPVLNSPIQRFKNISEYSPTGCKDNQINSVEFSHRQKKILFKYCLETATPKDEPVTRVENTNSRTSSDFFKI